MRNEVSSGMLRIPSFCCQRSVLSLVIVTLGIVHADAEEVADADGVADLEADGLAEGVSELSAEAPTARR